MGRKKLTDRERERRALIADAAREYKRSSKKSKRKPGKSWFDSLMDM